MKEAFGEQGVGRVLQILNDELRLAMVGCGTRTINLPYLGLAA